MAHFQLTEADTGTSYSAGSFCLTGYEGSFLLRFHPLRGKDHSWPHSPTQVRTVWICSIATKKIRSNATQKPGGKCANMKWTLLAPGIRGKRPHIFLEVGGVRNDWMKESGAQLTSVGSRSTARPSHAHGIFAGQACPSLIRFSQALSAKDSEVLFAVAGA